MKTDFEADFTKVKALSKKINKEIGEVPTGFLKTRQEFLIKRCIANCPAKDIKLQKSIKGKEVKNSKGKIEGEIKTEDCPEAINIHELPYKKTDQDMSTPEGGQGNRFIARPMEFHFSKTNEKALQDYMKMNSSIELRKGT